MLCLEGARVHSKPNPRCMAEPESARNFKRYARREIVLAELGLAAHA
jgi:hypothetical protein